MQKFSSQITFLNVRDFEAGKSFMDKILEFPVIYDIGWAVVYAVAEGAYLGVVDHSRSSIREGSAEGMLISLTTNEIETWHQRMISKLGDDVSPIREIPDAGLRSFFFHGPEGYCFEIQQFLSADLQKLF